MCSSKFHGFRIGRIGIVIKAATGFSAVPAGEDYALEQRRRGETLFLELVEHDLGDVIGSVQADEIEERERAHWIGAAELHGIINVHNRADSFFERANC